MEHAKHIIRAVLLLVLIAMMFVVVRHFSIPESFGEYGHFRFGSVEEYATASPVHGAPGACADCHDEQAETLADGKHSSVSCEVCHAPLSAHVKGDEKFAEMPKDRSFRLCGWCHQKLDARPRDFPQVVLQDHVAAGGYELKNDVCLECHEYPHDPSQ